MILKTIVVTAVIFFVSAHEPEAAMVYTFSDTPGGVQLSYSGSLNTSGLNAQAGLSASSRYIDILGVVVPGQQLYDFENFRPSPLIPELPGVASQFSANNISFSWNLATSARHYNASSAYGDTFGFYIFESSGSYTTWMNLPFTYTSGSPINGGMLFGGQTLSSMGLNASESFQVFLPGNEMISGMVVVPEPQSGALLAVAMLGTLALCRPNLRRAEQARSIEPGDGARVGNRGSVAPGH